MKKIFLSVLAFVLALAPLSSAYAADYLPKNKEAGGNVVVSGPEEYKNLYVGGGSVIINKGILGDLFAFGGSVNVAYPVEEDLFSAGGNISISAPVSGDVRVAGGNVALSAPVAGDLLIAGGTLAISEQATVGGDFWAAGGVVNLTAPVAGSAKIAGGQIYINSTISGTLEVNADESLTFGPSAVVLGKIVYCGPKEAVVEEGAQLGTIDYQKATSSAKKDFGSVMAGLAVLKTVALLVAALVALWVFKRRLPDIVDGAKHRFWNNVGIGFAGLVLIPMLSFLLIVTVFGGFVGGILFMWYMFAVLLAGVMSIIVLGHMVESWLEKKKALPAMMEGYKITWKTVLWGTLTGLVLSFVPFIGWLVLFVVYLGTLGGMMRYVKNNIL